MSLDLFNSVPAGAIEVLFDEANQPLFKRADLGRFLGLKDIKGAFRDVQTTTRRGVRPYHRSDMLGGDFKLLDLTRYDLYDLGVPALED